MTWKDILKRLSSYERATAEELAFEELIKNRRNIKIPKKKKSGKIDTSSFYSRPAQRDEAAIQRKKDMPVMQTSMTKTYEGVMERVVHSPKGGLDKVFEEIKKKYIKYNQDIKELVDKLLADYKEFGDDKEKITTITKKHSEKTQKIGDNYVKSLEPPLERYLKISKDIRNNIGLKGGNLGNDAHIKTLKTTVYREFKSRFDRQPRSMSQEDYKRIKPLVNKIKLTGEQNAKLKSDLAELKDIIKTHLNQINTFVESRKIQTELSLYDPTTKITGKSAEDFGVN